MEVISYSSASCPCITDSGRKILCALRPKLPARGRSKFFLVNFVSLHGSPRFTIASHFGPNVGVNGSYSLTVVRHPRKSYSRVFGESYSCRVIGNGEDAVRASEDGDVIPKVLIPGLPDKSRGEREASVHSCFWEWKPKFTVHYEKDGCENLESPQMLFLPGFGVGSFHYEKQLKDLGRRYRVWSLDFLGQGKSLPFEDPAPKSRNGKSEEGGDSSWGFGEESEAWASQLVYSIDLYGRMMQQQMLEMSKNRGESMEELEKSVEMGREEQLGLIQHGPRKLRTEEGPQAQGLGRESSPADPQLKSVGGADGNYTVRGATNSGKLARAVGDVEE